MRIDLNFCRLCKSTKASKTMDFVIALSESLLLKINYCTGLQISPHDILPKYICKCCYKKIKKFYDFKKTCLDVDLELRNLNYNADRSIKEGKSNINTFKNNTLWTNNNLDSPSKEYQDCDDGNLKTDLKANEKQCSYNTVCNKETLGSQDSQTIQCEYCGQIFEKKISFKKHVFSNHPRPKEFHCKFCSKMFTTAENCYTHIRSHLGIKPFICEICGKASTKWGDLVRHMKIHSDEKNYKCPTCGRGFKRSSDLCTHIRTHSRVRPYKCQLCEKDYTSHSGLRKHFKSHNKQHFAVT